MANMSQVRTALEEPTGPTGQPPWSASQVIGVLIPARPMHPQDANATSPTAAAAAFRSAESLWERDAGYRAELRSYALRVAQGEDPELDPPPQPPSAGNSSSSDCLLVLKAHVRPRAKVVSPAEWDKGTVELYDGSIRSSNCGFSISFNGTAVDLKTYFRKSNNLGVMMALATLAQVLVTSKEAEALQEPAMLQRGSILAMGIQAVMDAYLCIIWLTAAVVVEDLFNVMGSAAFLAFILFAIFELRIMLGIMRARSMGSSELDARTDLAALSCRFYMASSRGGPWPTSGEPADFSPSPELQALLGGVFLLMQMHRHMMLVT